MLPMKLELSKPLAIKLRDLRLNNPVNGEILTAENLSKAIGNNRAWMSQIESRRLKKIRREDIIAIYQLLFSLPSQDDAENKAENDLINYIISDKNGKMLIAPNNIVMKKRNDTNDKESFSDSIKNISNVYMDNCKELYSLLIDLYDTRTCDKDQLILAHQLQKIVTMFYEGEVACLDIISSIPIDLYKYADDTEKTNIQEKIELLSNELKKLETKRLLSSLDDRIEFIGSSILGGRRNLKNVNDTLIMGFMELAEIIFKPSTITQTVKIYYINQYIAILSMYARETNMLFTLESLPDNASPDDFNQYMNYMQSFINSLKGSSAYLLNQISDYFNEPDNQ